MKNEKGISLIALIITIIVIIILAAIVVASALSTPEDANFAKFSSNISNLQEAVAITYADKLGDEAILGNSYTQKQIYSWIASGVGTVPATTASATLTGVKHLGTGEDLTLAIIQGKFTGVQEVYKLTSATNIQGMDSLPGTNYFITDTGVVFAAPGFKKGTDTYATSTVKW